MTSSTAPPAGHAARHAIRPARPRLLGRPPAPTEPPAPLILSTGAADDALDPELHRVALAATRAIIDVVAGLRPLSHLEQRCTPDLLHTIGRIRRNSAGTDLRLRSVHLQSPCADVLEITATLWQGTMARAAALRIVHTENGWTCTHLETALTPRCITRG